jgi:two-component system, NtrC family, nitrogen regulation response regulator GlnG
MQFADDGPPTAELGRSALAVQDHLVLVVVSGPDRARRLTLTSDTRRVGKSYRCDLVLTDPSVSGLHLEITITAGAIDLYDPGSKNGSFYRGARFTALTVPPGAVIRIGQTELLVAAVSMTGGPELERIERLGRLYGRSRAMAKVFGQVQRFGRATLPMLITGESGTGKELAAEAAHAASTVRTGPFVVFDVAAVSPTLIESELFGHVRGAFTGAERDRPGAFELAHRGTIFLDEIGELDLALQPRLLRVLDTGHVKRVGDDRYRSVDVRVVTATNRDLAAEVAAGRFREDLYHRFAAAVVRIPPLRERLEDLPLLVEVILAELSARLGRHLVMPPAGLDVLASYDWPGNVRQLRNVLERAAAIADSDDLTRVALPIDLAAVTATGTLPGIAVPRDRVVDLDSSFKLAKQRLVTQWEYDYLKALLESCGGNVSLAARKAGIDRVHFHRLVRKHQL